MRKSGSNALLALACFALPWIAFSGQRPGEAAGRAEVRRLPHPAEVAIATPVGSEIGVHAEGVVFVPSSLPLATRLPAPLERLDPEAEARWRGAPDALAVATLASHTPARLRGGAVTQVPEPAAFSALMGSLAGLALARRWQRRLAMRS